MGGGRRGESAHLVSWEVVGEAGESWRDGVREFEDTQDNHAR